MASERKVTLKSSDDKLFNVTEAVASESQIIKYVIEDVKREDKDAPLVIPLPNVSSKILAKAIEYCKYHAQKPGNDKSATAEEETQIWDKEFVKVDRDTLFELNLAADYLNIKGLLDLTFQTVTDMLKGKTPEGIRKIFQDKE